MSKQILYLFSVLFCLNTHSAYSCGNAYWSFLNGKLHVTEGEMPPIPTGVPQGNDLGDYEIKSLFRAAVKRYEQSKTLENYADYGSVLMYQGKYQAAKNIFWNIEAKKPNLYNTAANLGTLCELLGQNDSALIWIQKAIAMNPDSHHGSEWIHVKILEAKIKAQQDTTYFQTHSILGLDFGNDATPETVQVNRKKYVKDLMYQLTERMTFIKYPDPIMAQLIFDLANLYALERLEKYPGDWTSAALHTYEKAIEYGFWQSIIEKRMDWVKKPIHQTSFEWDSIGQIWKEALGGFLVVIGCWWLYRSRRKG